MELESANAVQGPNPVVHLCLSVQVAFRASSCCRDLKDEGFVRHGCASGGPDACANAVGWNAHLRFIRHEQLKAVGGVCSTPQTGSVWYVRVGGVDVGRLKNESADLASL
jgi:hypothetical protein